MVSSHSLSVIAHSHGIQPHNPISPQRGNRKTRCTGTAPSVAASKASTSSGVTVCCVKRSASVTAFFALAWREMKFPLLFAPLALDTAALEDVFEVFWLILDPSVQRQQIIELRGAVFSAWKLYKNVIVTSRPTNLSNFLSNMAADKRCETTKACFYSSEGFLV